MHPPVVIEQGTLAFADHGPLKSSTFRDDLRTISQSSYPSPLMGRAERSTASATRKTPPVVATTIIHIRDELSELLPAISASADPFVRSLKHLTRSGALSQNCGRPYTDSEDAG